MRVYSYCSYKGAVNGYQYAVCKLEDELVRSFSTSEIEQKNRRTFLVIRDWFENRSNWKLVLWKASGNDEGILLFRKVEEARRLKKQRELDKIEESKIAAALDKRKETYESIDLNIFDSEFYINLAFVSSVDELRLIAVGILREIEKDGGEDLLDRIEKVFEKSEDRCYYRVNVASLKIITEDIKNCNIVKTQNHYMAEDSHKRGRLRSFLGRPRTEFQMHLKNKEGEERQQRKKKIEKFIDILLTQREYSKQLILFIGDESEELGFRDSNLSAESDYFIGRN